MVTFPNAKINIGLNVVARRPDGYHALQSCFYPVGWSDALEVLPAAEQQTSSVRFEASGIPIPPGDNLCVRAYDLLAGGYALPPVRIHLLKAIPIGAGLGGGSSDAAFTLKALNQLFELNLTVAQLQEFARELGSDCAFFIENTPKYCFGRGDEFEDIPLRLAGKWVVLVNPGIHISTAEAYAGVVPAPPPRDLRESLRAPVAQWRDFVTNDFEKQLFQTHPVLPQLKQALYELGAEYASMSGSGSTLYGLFEREPDAANKFGDFTVWKGELLH